MYSCRTLLWTFAIYICIFDMYLLLRKNWLRKFRTIALPVHLMVLNFVYDVQLSIIHVSKYCLMPITFYPSVVILRGGG